MADFAEAIRALQNNPIGPAFERGQDYRRALAEQEYNRGLKEEQLQLQRDRTDLENELTQLKIDEATKAQTDAQKRETAIGDYLKLLSTDSTKKKLPGGKQGKIGSEITKDVRRERDFRMGNAESRLRSLGIDVAQLNPKYRAPDTRLPHEIETQNIKDRYTEALTGAAGRKGTSGIQGKVPIQDENGITYYVTGNKYHEIIKEGLQGFSEANQRAIASRTDANMRRLYFNEIVEEWEFPEGVDYWTAVGEVRENVIESHFGRAGPTPDINVGDPQVQVGLGASGQPTAEALSNFSEPNTQNAIGQMKTQLESVRKTRGFQGIEGWKRRKLALLKHQEQEFIRNNINLEKLRDAINRLQ